MIWPVWKKLDTVFKTALHWRRLLHKLDDKKEQQNPREFYYNQNRHLDDKSEDDTDREDFQEQKSDIEEEFLSKNYLFIGQIMVYTLPTW